MPTVFDSGSADIVADQNNDIQVNIWDTSGIKIIQFNLICYTHVRIIR